MDNVLTFEKAEAIKEVAFQHLLEASFCLCRMRGEKPHGPAKGLICRNLEDVRLEMVRIESLYAQIMLDTEKAKVENEDPEVRASREIMTLAYKMDLQVAK